MTEFQLDETTQKYIADLNEQAGVASGPFVQRIQAALELTVRLNNLTGDWGLAPDGTKLVCREAPQAEFTKKSTRKK